MALDGSMDTTSIGVGAHQSHVLGARLQRPVSCSECHLVPQDVNDPGHIDTALPAEVLFGSLSSTASAKPAWDRQTRTCTNVYCHGATLDGGTNTTPRWDVVDGTQASCGSCHSLPPPAPHPNSTACEACHGPVAGPEMTLAIPNRHADGHLDLSGAAVPGGDLSDPAHDLVIDGLIPTYNGTSIIGLDPLTQTLKMPMNHETTSVSSEALSACTNCHPDAADGEYRPGLFHATIEDMGLDQPTDCTDCHTGSRPIGFVGPTAMSPERTPPSGEMKHDAVLWAGGTPSTTPAVPTNCYPCHVASGAPTWADQADAPVRFHASLGASSEPSSCVDCHANSRPALVSSANSTLPAGIEFDHTAPEALADCQGCHAASAPDFTSWAGGQFHKAGDPTPSSCLPCHADQRPTDTQEWMSTTYRNAPFDYGVNSLGITHGAGQDCVECHDGPGAGRWGDNQDWTGGYFEHRADSLAATTCINCHTTQRPDLLPGTDATTMAALLGFDHSTNGRGDCFGCHQATVAAGNYVSLFDPQTGMLPGGDWGGGIGYPGAVLVSSTNHFITVDEIVLQRSGPNSLVTGTSQRTSTYPNAFLHTSTQLPPEMNAGPTGNPDDTKCWHCHINNNGVVTELSNGVFHASLENYRASPGAPITPLAQPTVCRDCHTARPMDIVERQGSSLRAMDHAATFTAPVDIGGVTAGAASDLDCSTCHRSAAGSTGWNDGVFHANIGSAVPADCTSCHYPLMADGARSDVVSAGEYQMQHRSSQMTSQKCDTCHDSALSRSTQTPVEVTLWETGAFHPSLTTQPALCDECHAVAQPSMSTQGTTTYNLNQGASPTNQAQWMNHDSGLLAGRDCSVCHAGDATPSGSAWSKDALLHGPIANATSCSECHGLANGRGTVVGTNNNLPDGLIDSMTLTSAGPSTGVPSGTHDQISHADANVSTNDCDFCHTQQGASTNPALQGKEWAQASFHQNFGASNPLATNGTTARCSHCHMNVRPTAVYTQQDHSAFTATSPQDCADCHAWPGTDPTSPNWMGATGAHASSGPTTGSSLACDTCHGPGGSAATHLTVPIADHFGGTSNGNTCTSCHIDFSGFNGTVANLEYDHNNANANTNGCVTCHVFTNQLLTTLTNTPTLDHPTGNGHQFSQTQSVTGRFDGDSFTSDHTDGNLSNCGACHEYNNTTAGTDIWRFRHRPNNPGISNDRHDSGCNKCH